VRERGDNSSKRTRGCCSACPGAALCSLPVGYFVLPRLERVLPFVAVSRQFVDFADVLGLVLVPVSAVCSFIAFRHFVENRERYSAVTVVLALFNLVTTSWTGMVLLGVLFNVVQYAIFR
jgi:hypothetical protein